jgi:PIN domain nuclease of toxin-antitoxin system
VSLLIDTHALLWWLLNDRRFSARARTEIENPDNELFVSSASGWEISTKHRLGKLGLDPWSPSQLPRLLEDKGFKVLPISLAHALEAGSLPGPHGDPFDRLIIAQGRLEDLPIVTQDPAFARYDVALIW